MSRLFNKLIRSYLELKKPKDIHKAQWKTLKRKLKLFENTRIGKRYKFSEIKSIRDYQKMVPIHDYDSIKEYWDIGTDDYIKSQIISYALTSGTTGVRKLIPFTKEYLKDIRIVQKHIISIFLSKNPNYKFLSKKFLALAGNSSIGQTNEGINYGVITGLNMRYLNPVLTGFVLPELEVNDCKEKEKKNRIIANIIESNKVGVFIGISGVFVEFLKNLQEILDRDSYQRFCANVEALITSGSNYRVYKDIIFKLLGKEILFIDSYASSEGYFGYESNSNDEYQELFTTLNFYEFIPLIEFNRGNYENRYLVNELKDGVDYVILVTTSACVFSYIIGDIVRCISAVKGRIKLIGRTKLTINFLSEKVSINNVEEAFLNASDILNDTPVDFFVTAYLYKDKPLYHWFVVNNSVWQQHEKQFVSETLNEELCKVNVIYDVMIKSENIRLCTISYIDSKCIENWFDSINSDIGHRKLPRLIPDLKIVESIVGEGVINPE
ncbi:MAG: GH3 auxin-responsive promoter family protein [Bacteroidales bacterium]|jgi:acyl-CoA synthetase (AMP-forming)/AMP-acid ligase II|nr:GH3 auxin-responsive promoter family protein [Bacteroidales bacterium]